LTAAATSCQSERTRVSESEWARNGGRERDTERAAWGVRVSER
jgi:hypothetical protein